MKKNSFGQGVAVFIVVIGICYMIGAIGKASEPKCMKAGCDNRRASGSSYCYLHKPYTGNGSSHTTSSYSSQTSGSTSKDYTSSSGSGSYSTKSYTTNNSSYNSSLKKDTTTKASSYDSYDDGYDDIYMDGDYDYDRYDRDSDYADGVDDAMDEFGEEW